MAELKDLIVNGLTRLVGDAIYKTHAAGDNSDKIASTKYVDRAINNVSTDTKNTAGATNTDNKIFLIGATALNSSILTYSDISTWTQNGELNTSTLKATRLTVSSATISTASITTINGVTVGSSPKFTDTDTKVTSAANHYTPSMDSSFVANATGASAAWSIDVVKGVKVLKDSKGHVTGLEVVSGKTPANPVSVNTVTTTGTLSTNKIVLGAADNKTIKGTNVGIGTATFSATPNENTVATELGVKNYINGQLSGAMNFVGKTSTTMSDGQTTDPIISGHTFKAGDVVIDPTETEFVRDASSTPAWHKLGDANSYALADNVVNNITVKGDTWITPNSTTSQKGTVTVTLSHKALSSYLAKGSSTKVPLITTDAAGHVTNITEVTISTTDTKQNVVASNTKSYITGVTTAPSATTASLTAVDNASVYMENGFLYSNKERVLTTASPYDSSTSDWGSVGY